MKKLVLLSILLFACEPAEQEEMTQDVASTNDRSIQVKVIEVKRSNIQDYFVTTAQIQGYREIDLMSNVSGKVGQFRENGEYIKKGMPIFEIDSQLYHQQMKSAKSQLDAANRLAEKLQEDLKKYKSLLDSKDISMDEYKNHEISTLNAIQSARSAEVAYEQARLNYENAAYIAPFSGYLGQINLTVGQTVNPGMKIGKFADLSRLKAIVHLSIDEAVRFNKGDRAVFKNNSMMLEGVVESISPLADSQTGTYLTKIVFKNPESIRVISGMYGDIIIYGKEYQDVFVLDSDIITNKNEQYYIYTAIDNKTHEVKVHIDRNIGNQSIISGEINIGDKLITSSVGRLDNNIPVSIIQ